MPAKRPLIRRTAALAAGGGVVALSVRALSRPRPDTERRLLDWEVVRRTARARSGQQVRLQPETAERLASLYDVIAAEMVPLLAEVCGAEPRTIPRITVVDRHGFVDANLVIVRRMIDPLHGGGAETALTAVGRRLTSRYVGEVLGVMSQRVLGQYDPVLMLPAPGQPDATRPGAARPAGALYVVEPNIEVLQRSQGAEAEPLRRWLILHESTHAWQFESHPWLGPHLSGLMGELMATSLLEQPGGDGQPSLTPEVLRRLGGTVAGQLRGLSRVQAIMSVLEGYSNLVMHRVGRAHIDGFDRLEAAVARRHAQRNSLERLVLALTGVSLKLRQYDLGERFGEALIAAGGYPLLNRVWEGPAMMPTMAEVRAPERWIARTRRRG